MKKPLFLIAFAVGLGSCALAQNEVKKPNSPTSEQITESRSSDDAIYTHGAVITKGVTEHGPNDVNPPRTDLKPVEQRPIRTKESKMVGPEKLDIQFPINLLFCFYST